jgi:hypothetical protein
MSAVDLQRVARTFDKFSTDNEYLQILQSGEMSLTQVEEMAELLDAATVEFASIIHGAGAKVVDGDAATVFLAAGYATVVLYKLRRLARQTPPRTATKDVFMITADDLSSTVKASGDQVAVAAKLSLLLQCELVRRKNMVTYGRVVVDGPMCRIMRVTRYLVHVMKKEVPGTSLRFVDLVR